MDMPLADALMELAHSHVTVIEHQAHTTIDRPHWQATFNGRAACMTRSDLIGFCQRRWSDWLGPLDIGEMPKFCIGYGDLRGKCENPAGTKWSPFWCESCNQQRLESISAKLAVLAEDFERRGQGRK